MEQHAGRDLPDFNDLPVVEVAVSLMFAPIQGMRLVHLGLLWQQYRARYPDVVEQPPVPESPARGPRRAHAP